MHACHLAGVSKDRELQAETADPVQAPPVVKEPFSKQDLQIPCIPKEVTSNSPRGQVSHLIHAYQRAIKPTGPGLPLHESSALE